MQSSALNQLQGRVRSVRPGTAACEVVVRVGRRNMIAIIPAQAVDEMQLEAGDRVTLMINPSDVVVAREPVVSADDKARAVRGARRIIGSGKKARPQTRGAA